jgi:hypothetical protein
MASSLFVLLDDIATILDDVAVMTKVAAKKTAGVLGDDLALNAQQVTGVNADRELPVVWAVGVGSLINKAILVPAALAIATFASWAITPLLMIGGAFLCFEGFEKLAHKYLHSKAEDEAHHDELAKAVANPQVDMVQFEKDKIKGAVRTDFILSAEIIVISLGTVAARRAGGHLAGNDRGRLRPGGRHREAGRRGAVAVAQCQRRLPRLGPGLAGDGAVADEDAVGRRHRRDVPGGRRHPGAWDPGAAPPRRAVGGGPVLGRGGSDRERRQRAGGHRRRRHRAGRMDRRAEAAREVSRAQTGV